jgi:predicted P-loop ATPase
MNKDNEKKEVKKTSNVQTQPNISLKKMEKKLLELYDFRLNIISNNIEGKLKDQENFTEINENSIYRNLHNNQLPISMSKLKILLGSDFVKEYNPINSYFESIKTLYSEEKDGDYINKFLSFIKVSNESLFEITFKYWLVCSIRCCLDPTFFNKTIFVFFNSKQNSGKTTLSRFIVPPKLNDYFVENSTEGKDGLITLATAAFHLLDEMVALDRMVNREFKSFISKSKIDVRPPYGSKVISRNRITNFIGTSDQEGFLIEDVGTARFIVHEIDSIDFKYSKEINQDILWSQAYQYYKKNKFTFLSNDEKIEVKENNKRFIKVSILSEIISEYFKPGSKDNNDEFLQTKDILLFLSSTPNFKTISDRKIGEVLNSLGFVRTNCYLKDRKQNVYGYFVKRISTL